MSETVATTPILSWVNVVLGFSFILFDVITSAVLGLGVGRSLLTAAARCVLQLALVAGLLQQVFEAENPWAVSGITCKRGRTDWIAAQSRLFIIFTVLLNLLGTIEVG